MTHHAETTGSWIARSWFRNTAWAILIAAAAVEGYYAVFVRTGDVTCHIKFGKEFLDGIPYTNEGNFYPLGRVMFDSLFAIGDYRATRAVFYLASLVALAACFKLWGKTVGAPANGNANGDTRGRNFAAALATLIVLVPFILRDFDECGMQIVLLLFCSLGTYTFSQGRSMASGFWLAAAATYKATPLLFLPFLCWKREWKTAGAMVFFIVVLNTVPALHLGWEKMLGAHRNWYARVHSIAQDTAEAYPSVPEFELPKHQNESLAATIARFVETYPPGHPLHVDHPLFVQFGNLPADRAKLAVKVMTLILGAFVGWKMRSSYRSTETQAGEFGHASRDQIAAEWAVACAFSALLSPLCWKQHLVLFIPCVFVLARSVLDGHRQGRTRLAAMFVISAIFFWTHRMTVGQQLALIITSYNPVTFAAVAMSFLVLTNPKIAAAARTSLPVHRPGGRIPTAHLEQAA